MRRIKGVAKILEGLAVMPLPAPVEPDGDQRQKGQALAGKENILSEKHQLIAEAAQDLLYKGQNVGKVVLTVG